MVREIIKSDFDGLMSLYMQLHNNNSVILCLCNHTKFNS